MRYFSRHSALYLKIKEHVRVIKTDKKRVKIVFAVLNAVRSTFSETNEFIDSSLAEECEKEGMTADEVIFYKFKSKKNSLGKHFCFRFGAKVFIFLFIDVERRDR